MYREFTLTARDGFPLAAQSGGDPDAPALLLFPGQANSHHWWDTTRVAFEDAGLRTLTVDYRGSGGSRGTRDSRVTHSELGDWSAELFAQDAVDALDRLGIATAAVFGTSMGGRVAQMLAIHHPERVSALVLGCTSPGGEHAVERTAETRRWLARGSRDHQRAKLFELFYTPQWPGTPEQSTLLGDPTMSPREQVGHRRASDRHDAWDLLPTITAPALVLHGTEDLMVPVENAGLIVARIPNAGLRLYPGLRHGFFEEAAEQVVPDVLGYLADVGPSGP